jgi:uncharacterized protein
VNNQRQPFAAGQWVKLEIILTMQTMNKLTVFLIPRLRLWLERTVLSVMLMAMAAGTWAQEPQTGLPRTLIQAGMYQIDAQLATTPGQRQIGLMNRKDMATHEGMLFIFEEPQTQCFWMKNTLLPLTAAFIADNCEIVNLVDMQPQTTDSHCSDKPVRFVLEMHQGWFEKKKIGKGYKLKASIFVGK